MSNAKVGRRLARVRLQSDGLSPKGIIRGTQFQSTQIKDEFCVYCGKPADTWEHVIPRSLGGNEGHYNRVRACLECNQARGSKPFLVWMIQNHISPI